MKQKGFTLIELIVVMAIIAILVLIAAPKFMGYTEKAKLTQVINDIKVSEKAAEQYYLKNDEWPRDQLATPYSDEQLSLWVDDFRNLAGETVTLEDGDYYDIDWELMKPFMNKPNNEFKYIIQNPVGDIYYAYELTQLGETLGKFEIKKEIEIVWEFTGISEIADASKFGSGNFAINYPLLKKVEIIKPTGELVSSVSTGNNRRMASINLAKDKVFFYKNISTSVIVHTLSETGVVEQVGPTYLNFPYSKLNSYQTNGLQSEITNIQEVSTGNYVYGPVNTHLMGEGTLYQLKWYYGGYRFFSGCTPNLFLNPSSIYKTGADTVLIADTGNNRIIEVRNGGSSWAPNHTSVFQYGVCGVAGKEINQLNGPKYAEKFENGNYLITDTGNHRVIIITPTGDIIWQYGETGVSGLDKKLKNPERAKIMPDGSIMIVDTGNNRVLIVK